MCRLGPPAGMNRRSARGDVLVGSAAVAERLVRAYITGTEREDQPENIHTDRVAREMGYRGGLVYGTQVYGWAIPLIVDALGEEWARDGWADFHVRRPVYGGDLLRIRLECGAAGEWSLVAHGEDDRPRIEGKVGRGIGAWVASHHRSIQTGPVAAPDPRPGIALETAPVGQDLPVLSAPAQDRLSRMFQEATEHDAAPFTVGGRHCQSPAALTGRMTWYVHAIWDYAGPALHARSQIQYLAVAGIDEPLTVAGHLAAAYDRNGHHYAETDGIIRGADGRELALTRHASIFRVAKREG